MITLLHLVQRAVFTLCLSLFRAVYRQGEDLRPRLPSDKSNGKSKSIKISRLISAGNGNVIHIPKLQLPINQGDRLRISMFVERKCRLVLYYYELIP